MKLSTKGRYAVMAMVDIGQNGEGRTVSLAEIAGRQDISQEYLEQLFVKLRKAGLVQSARGPGGGYRLARDADDIVIYDVIAERCCTHDLWSSIGRQVNTFLANVTLDDVVSRRNLALEASIRQAKARHIPKFQNEADAHLS